jgi:hypothetical protein
VNFGDNSHDAYELTLPTGGEWVSRFNSTWKGYSEDFREIMIDKLVCDEGQKVALPLSAYQVLILSKDA